MPPAPPVRLAIQQSTIAASVAPAPAGVVAAMIFGPLGPSSAQEQGSSVEGTVKNDVTGEPLRKATVSFRLERSAANPVSVPQTVLTDDAGRFTLKGISSGSYTVMAAKVGFLPVVLGESPTLPRGTPVTIAAGQPIAGMDFRLKPQAVVSGRVVDERGRPVSNIIVATLQARETGGRRQLLPTGSTKVTDDLGRYRLFGLRPGRYYVIAVNRAGPSIGLDVSANPKREGYVDTYYPGTPDALNAVPIDMSEGSDTQGIDIKLPKVRTTRIRGRVDNQTGADNPVTVTLNTAGSVFLPQSATPGPRGEFELRVVPGRYEVTADMFLGGRSIRASLPVEVKEEPVDDLLLTLTDPLEVSGRIRVEPGADAPIVLAALSVTLRAPGPISVGNVPVPASVGDAGNFVLSRINPGRYYLSIGPLPAGYYIKSARMGIEDVKENGVELIRGVPAAIEVVLSPKAGTITGSIRDNRGTSIGGATVVLVPEPLNRRGQPHWYAVAPSNSSGSYTLSGLTPGDYRLFAWTVVAANAWMNPDFLSPFEIQGLRVTVREGSTQRADLRVLMPRP
jgi:protocatechuate 3,4-dioxygenase beta subunit